MIPHTPLPANKEGLADMTIISASISRILLLISFKIHKSPKKHIKINDLRVILLVKTKA